MNSGRQRQQLRVQFDAIVYRNVRQLIRLIGMDILDDHYEPSMALTFVWVMVYSFSAICIINIVIGDAETKIETLSYLSLAFQGNVKLYTGVRYRQHYNELLEDIRNMYRRVERAGSKELQHKTNQFFAYFCFTLNGQCCIVLSTGIVLTIFPAVAYVFLGLEYVPVIPISLPWLDTSRGFGYVADTVYGEVSAVLGVFGILASDAFFLILSVHSYLMSLVIQYEVKQLNGRLDGLTVSNRDGRAECVKQYYDIIELQAKYYFYTLKVSNLYYYISTVEVYTDGFAMCSLIYIILKLNSAPAYGLFVVVFGKLVLFSILGMVMEISNTELYACMLTINWYELPITLARHMISVVQFAQNAVPLKAGAAQLNMSLFVDIMKSVYTVAMMLVQMEDDQ